MSTRREQMHVAVLAALGTITDCTVFRNRDLPVAWDGITTNRVVILRDGGHVAESRALATEYRFLPTVEGHVRADDAETLGTLLDVLWGDVIRVVTADHQLGGVSESVDVGAMEEPEINRDAEPGPAAAFAQQFHVLVVTSETDPAIAA